MGRLIASIKGMKKRGVTGAALPSNFAMPCSLNSLRPPTHPLIYLLFIYLLFIYLLFYDSLL
jgi:hypothetical protein